MMPFTVIENTEGNTGSGEGEQSVCSVGRRYRTRGRVRNFIALVNYKT